MKIKVVKVKANNIMDLLNAIHSGEFNKALEEIKEPNKKTEEDSKELSLETAISNIANKKGWKFEKANRWLWEIAELSPMAAFNIVARELAIELDKKYEGHIEDSEKIYVISSLDGRIHEVPKNKIKNYRNFAAFRTLEDAKTVCHILKIPLKKMFKGEKKQED